MSIRSEKYVDHLESYWVRHLSVMVYIAVTNGFTLELSHLLRDLLTSVHFASLLKSVMYNI